MLLDVIWQERHWPIDSESFKDTCCLEESTGVYVLYLFPFFWSITIKKILLSHRIYYFLKEKVTPKNLPFFASTCSLFPLTEVSTCKVPAILNRIRLQRNPKFDFVDSHFEIVLGSQAVLMWRHIVLLEISEKEKYLQLTSILSKVSKMYLLKTIIHSTTYTAIVSKVWLATTKKYTFHGVTLINGIKRHFNFLFLSPGK